MYTMLEAHILIHLDFVHTAISDPKYHMKKVYEPRSGAISPIIYEGDQHPGVCMDDV